jgi:hypothetical protein
MSFTRTPEPVAPKKTIGARLQELQELQYLCTSVLSRDEIIAEFAHLLAELEKHGADTIVQPPKGGYQPNNKGITAAAEKWPLPGKDADARRKHVERAVKIANLAAEVKAAAVEAELQNKRSALLEIAKEKGLEAQLSKIKEIKARRPPKRKKKSQAEKSDEAYSMLTHWWKASPPDAKTRFRLLIEADLTQAA